MLSLAITAQSVAAQAVNPADWCNSVKDMAPTTQPADGTVCGQAFKVYGATFTSSSNNFAFDELVIKSQDGTQVIDVKFDTGYTLDDLQGKTLTFIPQSHNLPTVTLKCASTGNSDVFNSMTGLGLKMMFGSYDHGAIGCKIILRVPGQPKSNVQGAFAIVM